MQDSYLFCNLLGKIEEILIKKEPDQMEGPKAGERKQKRREEKGKVKRRKQDTMT